MEPTFAERVRQPGLVLGHEAVKGRPAAMVREPDVEQRVHDVRMIGMRQQLEMGRAATHIGLEPADKLTVTLEHRFTPAQRRTATLTKLLPFAERHRLRLPHSQRHGSAVQLEDRVGIAARLRPHAISRERTRLFNRRRPRIQRFPAKEKKPGASGELYEIARRLQPEIELLDPYLSADGRQVTEQPLNNAGIGVRLDDEAVDLPSKSFVPRRDEAVDSTTLDIHPGLPILFQGEPMLENKAEGE